ncbi:MAG: hypothetical protein AB2693_12540 [Candidatus Thiodiazotropha sp.]
MELVVLTGLPMGSQGHVKEGMPDFHNIKKVEISRPVISIEPKALANLSTFTKLRNK